jgi:hypothetical protein
LQTIDSGEDDDDANDDRRVIYSSGNEDPNPEPVKAGPPEPVKTGPSRLSKTKTTDAITEVVIGMYQ